MFSNAGKFKRSDERNGSVAALDTLELIDLYPPGPPLPKRTCKCASRRSRPSKDNAWLLVIAILRDQ